MLLEILRRQMGVAVSHPEILMTQQMRDSEDRHAIQGEMRSEGVPQIMQANVGVLAKKLPSRFAYDLSHGVWNQARENLIASSGDAQQDCHRIGSERDPARLAVFRFAQA